MWLLLLLLLASRAPAQPVQDSNTYTAPGQRNVDMHTAAVVKAAVLAATDTTFGVWIGAVDKMRLFARYASRNDSINVVLWLDIAPINDPDFFVPWAKIDSAIVSGTADTTRYVTISSPPDDAHYGRLRAVPRMAVGDTVDLTTKFTLTRLPAARYQ